MALIQFFIIAFIIFAISRTILSFQRGRLNTLGLIAWLGLWLVVSVASLLPRATYFFAHLVGVERGTDLALYVSVVLLFYIVFKIYAKLEKIESEITTIVREISFKPEQNKK